MNKSAQVKPQHNATVDMNPMLDVVFILLIFFIVTASFNRETALDIERSHNSVQAIKPSVTPQFTINHQNQVFLNHQKISIDTININIARLAVAGDITSINLRAHPQSMHNTFVSVLNAIKSQTAVPVSVGELTP